MIRQNTPGRKDSQLLLRTAASISRVQVGYTSTICLLFVSMVFTSMDSTNLRSKILKEKNYAWI
jgi:hypothetical protein